MGKNIFEDFPAIVEDLDLKLNYVVHVGAHKGTEMPFFKAAGISKFTLVEPQPDYARRLRRDYPEAEVLQAGCGEEHGTATLSVNRIHSSSTLAKPHELDQILATHKVEVFRLDEIASDADCAVVDAQGLELEVLKGANLQQYKLVVVETCTARDSTMSSFYQDVVAHMAVNGFGIFREWYRDYRHVSKYVRGAKGGRLGEATDKIIDVIFVRKDLM